MIFMQRNWPKLQSCVRFVVQSQLELVQWTLEDTFNQKGTLILSLKNENFIDLRCLSIRKKLKSKTVQNEFLASIGGKLGQMGGAHSRKPPRNQSTINILFLPFNFFCKQYWLMQINKQMLV